MRSLLIALLVAASPAAVRAAAPNSDEAKAVMLSAPSNTNAKPDKGTPQAEAEKNKKDDFDLAQMLALFDKLFPAQPDPAPDRLALARVTANGLFPNGTYGKLFDGMMNGMVNRVMNLSEADFGKKSEKGKPASAMTLREQAMKDDPHFKERMAIMQRVIGEEMAKIATLLEPKLREGMARSMARRFDAKQLADINAFLASDSGRAFGSQSMAMWVDSDVMRAMMGSFPEIFAALPGAMQRVEAATAHLPKPPKGKDEEAKDKKSEDQADEAEAAAASGG